MPSNMLLKGLAVSLLSLMAAGCVDDLAATSPATAAQSETTPASKQLHQLFADTFEAGDVCAWDSAVGGPPCPGAP